MKQVGINPVSYHADKLYKKLFQFLPYQSKLYSVNALVNVNWNLFSSGRGQLCDQGGNRFQYHMYRSRIDNTQRYEGIAAVRYKHHDLTVATIFLLESMQLAQFPNTVLLSDVLGPYLSYSFST